jgi:hypothetical protein
MINNIGTYAELSLNNWSILILVFIKTSKLKVSIIKALIEWIKLSSLIILIILSL